VEAITASPAFWTVVCIGGLVWFGIHLAKFNRRACPRCGGSGKLRSGVFSERFRTCSRCGGSGEIRGWFGRKDN
jgi:predicted  nucleic acid-binding Zn ribbon protein